MNFRDQYRKMLERELSHRVEVNSSYSLRAFSRDIGLQPPRLSLILRGRQGLSAEKAALLTHKLGWSEEECQHFCDLVAADTSRSRKERELAMERIKVRFSKLSTFKTITDDEFRVMSDWYYFCFLQLTRTAGFRTDKKWIAKKLGLSLKTVEELLKRLIRLELIDPKTYLEKTATLETQNGVPSHAIRKFNKKLLNKASTAIDEQSITDRHISSNTVAIPEGIKPEVFDKLDQMRRELDQFILEKSKGLEKTEVYCFTSQFFRLTEEGN